MNRDDIFMEIKKVVIEEIGVDAEDVTMEVSFDDLDADSLDRVQLVMALEDGFGLKITDEEAQKLTSIKEAVDFVAERKI